MVPRDCDRSPVLPYNTSRRLPRYLMEMPCWRYTRTVSEASKPAMLSCPPRLDAAIQSPDDAVRFAESVLHAVQESAQDVVFEAVLARLAGMQREVVERTVVRVAVFAGQAVIDRVVDQRFVAVQQRRRYLGRVL